MDISQNLPFYPSYVSCLIFFGSTGKTASIFFWGGRRYQPWQLLILWVYFKWISTHLGIITDVIHVGIILFESSQQIQINVETSLMTCYFWLSIVMLWSWRVNYIYIFNMQLIMPPDLCINLFANISYNVDLVILLFTGLHLVSAEAKTSLALDLR